MSKKFKWNTRTCNMRFKYHWKEGFLIGRHNLITPLHNQKARDAKTQRRACLESSKVDTD